MDCNSTRLPYRQTGAFSGIVLDYIDQDSSLKEFFKHPPTLPGIQKAIAERKNFKTNRATLVAELKKQYSGINCTEAVSKNISLLGKENTFSITTAHQNNLFTGPLYFIYKIIHVIALAEHLNKSIPGNFFVPVFYMGSEDADLEELNHIYIDGEKQTWNTKQTGAVGRMKVDKELLAIITKLEGRLSVLAHGNEIISILKDSYKIGTSLQEATFRFINELFGKYGLLVLIADTAGFKKQMLSVFENDIIDNTALKIVESTAKKLAALNHKPQAKPRPINLFYLADGLRERIELNGSVYQVVNTNITFSKDELLKELKVHPERFSPNVILRGIFQEKILPNIAFIGGGGELAYWLELRSLFDKYEIPFPVLVLRNSYMIVEKKWRELIAKLGFVAEDFFATKENLLKRIVDKQTKNELGLIGTVSETEKMYLRIREQAAAIDSTLEKHVDALKKKTVHYLKELEKKMIRAEKRKYSDQLRQIERIKNHLFPANGLQERFDNILYYYASYGSSFIDCLRRHALNLEQEFVIIS